MYFCSSVSSNVMCICKDYRGSHLHCIPRPTILKKHVGYRVGCFHATNVLNMCRLQDGQGYGLGEFTCTTPIKCTCTTPIKLIYFVLKNVVPFMISAFMIDAGNARFFQFLTLGKTSVWSPKTWILPCIYGGNSNIWFGQWISLEVDNYGTFTMQI